ncbi:WSSV074 [White spot syndrome virus]|uniref:WSSV074 n=1 Tax=White spot syndrome virus TaxID=342409 RepID=A0A2I6SBJ9_9VIRU|nr:WSSV074 [White spot syndrome virus]
MKCPLITHSAEMQSLALNILRGVNCSQLPRKDIGDTAGLLTFITSRKFAGYGGEGEVCLYTECPLLMLFLAL